MKITIPPKFISILEKNDKVYGSILKLTSEFSDWFSDNKTEFFPEYTDHGIDHIESVLKTAEELITDGSYQLLSPQDIYVLIMSILLHDCAMHINREGLWDLLSRDVYNGVSLGFDDQKEWRHKWEEFCSDVKRFTESDWNSFFGEYREVDIPEIGCSSLNDNQKIIIGDFVRRHHATIAQVIVNNGIPSKNGPQDIFDAEFRYLNQLSGFIARSHNYSLREAMDMLGDDRKREHREIHPTYLMGVLRIADYIQFKSERTPKILFDTKGFCSPISIKEWKKHLAIISTNQSHPDEELLFVEAFPEDAITLTAVRKLLMNFQKELDEFWACSGEVYSRYPKLKDFSIIYRRVRSNIDNPKDYVQKNHKSYHPEVLSIEADNQKLFPLLIKPLYGDLPGVGLRELMQNSIDACNERYALDIGRKVNAEFIPYRVDILLDYDEKTVTLSDNGVGMTADIIKNYFLKIGASYRTAESWKAQYSNSEGVHIPRTGKFGIGMLAGFLIGDEIEVHTAHVSNINKAIKFNYKIDSKEIALSYVNKNEIGTSIKIFSTDEKISTLEKLLGKDRQPKYYRFRERPNEAWWYYLDSPMISINVVKASINRKLSPFYVIKKHDMYESWFSLSETILENFFWQRNKKYNYLYCNGVLIKDASNPNVSLDFGIDKISIEDLEISIFDNKGIFPINLTRDNVIGDDFFELDLIKKSVNSNLIFKYLNLKNDYKFSKTKILQAINQYFDGSYFPIIFSKKEPIPFASSAIDEKFVFVDFLYPSQNRGIIYLDNFIDLIDGMAYSCFVDAEKQGTTVDQAIGTLVVNSSIKDSYHWRGNGSNLQDGLTLDGWVFVKAYDFKKSSFYDETSLSRFDLIATDIDIEWVVISRQGNEKRIPAEGSKIISGLDPKIFIFSIFSFEPQETEFSLLWNSQLNTDVDV